MLNTHFTPGNVIYNSYWMKHDLVLEFNSPAKSLNWSNWDVLVQSCDKDGNVIEGSEPRYHCTYPDSKNKIVKNIY